MTGSTNASLENIALVLDGGGPNLADTRSLEAHHPIQILHNGRQCVGAFATETVEAGSVIGPYAGRWTSTFELEQQSLSHASAQLPEGRRLTRSARPSEDYTMYCLALTCVSSTSGLPRQSSRSIYNRRYRRGGW